MLKPIAKLKELAAQFKACRTVSDQTFLERVFDAEVVRKTLLSDDRAVPRNEDVIREAKAVEAMLHSDAWRIYEKAVWRVAKSNLISSLFGKTAEVREQSRAGALAAFHILKLPQDLAVHKRRAEMVQSAEEAVSSLKQ